jgi:hypothetical protein
MWAGQHVGKFQMLLNPLNLPFVFLYPTSFLAFFFKHNAFLMLNVLNAYTTLYLGP